MHDNAARCVPGWEPEGLLLALRRCGRAFGQVRAVAGGVAPSRKRARVALRLAHLLTGKRAEVRPVRRRPWRAGGPIQGGAWHLDSALQHSTAMWIRRRQLLALLSVAVATSGIALSSCDSFGGTPIPPCKADPAAFTYVFSCTVATPTSCIGHPFDVPPCVPRAVIERCYDYDHLPDGGDRFCTSRDGPFPLEALGTGELPSGGNSPCPHPRAASGNAGSSDGGAPAYDWGCLEGCPGNARIHWYFAGPPDSGRGACDCPPGGACVSVPRN
jgi:hypothetical protein